MANRISITANRLVYSKAGFNAHDPNLADEDKIFDSSWNFSGAVIASGYAEDPNPRNSGGFGTVDPRNGLTSRTSDWVIPFPAQTFIPNALVLRSLNPYWYYYRGNPNEGYLAPYDVYAQRDMHRGIWTEPWDERRAVIESDRIIIISDEQVTIRHNVFYWIFAS